MSATPHRSLLVKTWNAFAWLAASGRSRQLDADALMEAAQKIVGAADFDDTSFVEPLRSFLSAIEETGELHAFGRFYLSKLVSGILVNRLKLEDLWRRHPEIAEEEVQSPLIILGLPRTGTSLLLKLLAQDPAHRYLSNWELTVSQVPPNGDHAFESDPRRKLGRRLLKLQGYLAPQLSAIHEFCLDGPEECTPLLMQTFATQALSGMFNVPAYSEWLDGVERGASYTHHKRILQTLQWTYPKQRWLLKAPLHMEAVDALLAVYPDANLVQMTRDPVKSIPSYASLCSVFRGICAGTVDAKELGSQVMSQMGRVLDSFIKARAQCDASRFHDIAYGDLVKDPLSMVRGIYQRFDLAFSAEAEASMKALLAKERGRSSQHHYGPEDFGLSPEGIRRRLQAYVDAFAIAEER
ncbi:MAG: sulfotransferase [Deltaproteobacteria bacterium]|nr:sulfotransferase [Deltaproteobacteria bacterium]